MVRTCVLSTQYYYNIKSDFVIQANRLSTHLEPGLEQLSLDISIRVMIMKTPASFL